LFDSVESMMMHGLANPKFKNKMGRFVLNYVVSCPWTRSFSQTSFGEPQISLGNFKFKNVYLWHPVLYHWHELSTLVPCNGHTFFYTSTNKYDAQLLSNNLNWFA